MEFAKSLQLLIYQLKFNSQNFFSGQFSNVINIYNSIATLTSKSLTIENKHSLMTLRCGKYFANKKYLLIFIFTSNGQSFIKQFYNLEQNLRTQFQMTIHEVLLKLPSDLNSLKNKTSFRPVSRLL